jgi:outer membrane protein TolC
VKVRIESSKELAFLLLEIDRAKLALDLVEDQTGPQFALKASVGLTSLETGSLNSPMSQATNRSLLLEYRLPLLNSAPNRARIYQAQSNIETRRLELDILIEAVISDAEKEYSEFRDAMERIDLLNEQVDLATQRVKVYRLMYDEGLLGRTEFRLAQERAVELRDQLGEARMVCSIILRGHVLRRSNRLPVTFPTESLRIHTRE